MKIARMSAANDPAAAVERLVRRATDAVAARDADGYASCFDVTSLWGDPDRSLQAHHKLCELIDGTSGPDMYAAAARGIFGALQADALEPWRWNALGGLLFRLGHSKAAARCFKACLRLEPEWPQARANLAVAQTRRHRAQLNARLAAAVKALADHADTAARAVRVPQPGTISLVMIVRDEEAMLADCLASVRDVVDEMIVVDTGSKDGTAQIAESYGARVVSFPWNGSFADARNVSLDHATCDWVLWLDADERLHEDDGERLRALAAKPWRAALYLDETNLVGTEAASVSVTHAAMRLLRNRPQVRFEGRIHEQITGLPTYLGARFERTTVRLLHLGYLKHVVDGRDKFARNVSLLLDDARENKTPFNRFNLGNEYLIAGLPGEAVTYYDEAWESVRRDPHSQGYLSLLILRRGRAHRLAGNLDIAEQALREGISLLPDFTDLVAELAQVAAARGDIGTAEDLLEQAMRMGPAPTKHSPTDGAHSYRAMSALADIKARDGDYAQAAEILRGCLDDHPDYQYAYGQLADVLLAAGTPSGQVLAELEPRLIDRPSALLVVATALLEAGHPAEAEPLFSRAVQLQPANTAARVGGCEAALSRGDLEAARQAVTPVDASAPDAAALVRSALFVACLSGDDLAELSGLAEDCGVPEHELGAYRAWSSGDAQALGQNKGEALRLLGACLRAKAFSAVEQLQTLLEQSSSDPDVLLGLGDVYLRNGYLDSAAEMFCAHIDRVGENADNVVALAQVAVADGNRDLAAGLADEALTYDADHAAARALKHALA